MLFSTLFQLIILAMGLKLVFSWWVLPYLAFRKLRSNGFFGPQPFFPFGNLNDIKRLSDDDRISSSTSSFTISNDIHSTVFSYFAHWQKLHGKVYVYWLGTEEFLYIAEPEMVKQMCADVKGKNWGKPNVFKNDRHPMFGNGLNMVEGDDWVRHRRLLTPAFSPANLKAMTSLMVESARTMVDTWTAQITSGFPEIDVEKSILKTAGEIIAKSSFGITDDNGGKLLHKLRQMQITLFKSNRFIGVPFANFLLDPTRTLRSRSQGREIDDLFNAVIADRRKAGKAEGDLLGLMVAAATAMSTDEVVDECKTFFFGGYETTSLALTWSLMLLAVHPQWQMELRDEIKEVIGDEIIDYKMLAGLKKMGWVMSEVLRLYPSSPNVQRQARQDITVSERIIPSGTNVWIDVVSMHHDPNLWGEDVNEFKPERFKENVYGGCNHKMGYLPFGFGGRMCVGKNLSIMEYKIVLTLILTRFSFSLSPNYCHKPSILFSLRPMHGLPLIFKPL